MEPLEVCPDGVLLGFFHAILSLATNGEDLLPDLMSFSFFVSCGVVAVAGGVRMYQIEPRKLATPYDSSLRIKVCRCMVRPGICSFFWPPWIQSMVWTFIGGVSLYRKGPTMLYRLYVRRGRTIAASCDAIPSLCARCQCFRRALSLWSLVWPKPVRVIVEGLDSEFVQLAQRYQTFFGGSWPDSEELSVVGIRNGRVVLGVAIKV